MGQSVGTDKEPSELKSLFKLGQTQQLPAAASGCSPLLEGGVRHNVKAWKFEKTGRNVVDSPVRLCDQQGVFAVDLNRTCSYLILHVNSHDSFVGGNCPPSSAAVMEELAARASGTCTPRGLVTSVVTQSEVGGCEGSGLELSYAIFVWHGVSVDPRVKAQVLTKAFELDRLLRIGLAWQPAIQGAPGLVMTLKPSGKADRGRSVQDSGNRLLSGLLDGLPQAASLKTSLMGAAMTVPSSTRGSGIQRFPHLGRSVCQSLGLAPTAGGWLQEQRRAVPAAVVPPAPAQAGPVPGHAGLMPRLQLGTAHAGIAKREVPSCEVAAAGFDSMDVDSSDGPALDMGGRKRLRGPDFGARPLQSPRSTKSEGSDLSGQRSGGREASSRTDAPAMLNLEEINMPEEELLRLYDPNNEENNYHLPNHLYKKLQLDQYRPVCSEIIKGSLFISSHQVAGDLDVLRSNGITHIVNTAADVCFNHFPGQVEYLTYYLKDSNNEEISALFYKTITWIDAAIQRGGRVLVHCREGVSRSATMIIAYLMWKHKITFESAHEKVRKVRPICNPNTGFTCQLLVLGKKLGFGAASNPQSPPSDKPMVFRVGPYHKEEPFLLLVPTEWMPSPDCPNFDPRFGWVVQRGLESALWIGAQVIDAEAVQSTARQHCAWLQCFENLEVRLSIVQDGLEPSRFWQLLGLASPPTDRCKFTATRPAFDGDAEVLASSQAVSSQQVVVEELEISSPREEDVSATSPGTTDSEPSPGFPGRQMPGGSVKPPPSVPGLKLALGGLR